MHNFVGEYLTTKLTKSSLVAYSPKTNLLGGGRGYWGMVICTNGKDG